MTRSIRGSRRAALLLAGLATATGLLSGCGAGQVAETSAKQSSIGGVNVQTPDNLFKVRDLSIAYKQAYESNSDAPVAVVIYNDSEKPVTVRVSTDGARQVLLAGKAAEAAAPKPTPSEPAAPAGPSAGASPSAGAVAPTPSPAVPTPAAPTPAPAPAGIPAEIKIPANSYAQLNQQSGTYLLLVGIKEALRSGQAVNLVFDFGNGVTLTAGAPVAVPLTPPPPATPIVGNEEGEGASAPHHG